MKRSVSLYIHIPFVSQNVFIVILILFQAGMNLFCIYFNALEKELMQYEKTKGLQNKYCFILAGDTFIS